MRILGAHTYTVRDFMGTAEELTKTLKKIRAIGYTAAEMGVRTPLGQEGLLQLLRDEGLSVPTAYGDYNRLRDKPEEVAEQLRPFGVRNVAIGSMPDAWSRRLTEDDFRRFADEASGVAQRLKALGLRFCYHHHSFELERFGDKTGLEILADETDPGAFNFELDTYWIQHGGGNPIVWLKRLKGRCPVIHLKDLAMSGHEQQFAEVGEGNLDWAGILPATREAGAECYYVEQDKCARDPFESLKISFDNLQRLGWEA